MSWLVLSLVVRFALAACNQCQCAHFYVYIMLFSSAAWTTSAICLDMEGYPSYLQTDSQWSHRSGSNPGSQLRTEGYFKHVTRKHFEGLVSGVSVEIGRIFYIFRFY